MYQRSLAIVISPPLPISLLDSLEGKILDQYCRHHDDEKLSRRRYYVEDLNEIEIEYDQTLVDLIDARDDSCPIARVLRQDADGKQIGDEIDFDVIELETVLQSLVANSNGQLERIVVEYGWYSDCATAGQIGGAAAIITRDCINRHSVWDWVRDVLIAAGTTVDSLAAR